MNTISGKNAATLERYKLGVNARNGVAKMKLEHLSEVANSPKPTWASVLGTAPKDLPVIPLVDKATFERKYGDKHCKSLSWNATSTDIGDGRTYRGEYSREGAIKPEGLCIIDFSDGSEYRGYFANNQFNGRGQMT